VTPSEADNVRILQRYLDRDWLAPKALRAFKALCQAAQECPVDCDPAQREPEHLPGDVVVSLSLGPALLDPAGGIVR
jgi:hypothetical protein